MSETREIRLKRLHYRSWHRGCKETDVILGHFADTHLEGLSDGQLDVYERLLDEQDADIWQWLIGKDVPSRQEYTPVIKLLRQFSKKRFRINHAPEPESDAEADTDA